jgi:hypothetical protein
MAIDKPNITGTYWLSKRGQTIMTLLLTTLVSVAFAGLYAVVIAMLGSRSGAIAAALFGRRGQSQAGGMPALAASRRFNRA